MAMAAKRPGWEPLASVVTMPTLVVAVALSATLREEVILVVLEDVILAAAMLEEVILAAAMLEEVILASTMLEEVILAATMLGEVATMLGVGETWIEVLSAGSESVERVGDGRGTSKSVVNVKSSSTAQNDELKITRSSSHDVMLSALPKQSLYSSLPTTKP